MFGSFARAVVRFCAAASPPARKKTETFRERGAVPPGGAAAAGPGVGEGFMPGVGTSDGLVTRGEDGEDGEDGEVDEDDDDSEDSEDGENGETGDDGESGDNVPDPVLAAVAVGTSPAEVKPGDLICTPGKATGGVAELGGDRVVMGEGGTTGRIRGGCVVAGCPYTAGAADAELACVTGAPFTAGTALEKKPLLGA